MTGEVVLRDLHCHTLQKSKDSWDFLCLHVYGDVSENTWPRTLRRILGLSLVSDPQLRSWLSGIFLYIQLITRISNCWKVTSVLQNF